MKPWLSSSPVTTTEFKGFLIYGLITYRHFLQLPMEFSEAVRLLESPQLTSRGDTNAKWESCWMYGCKEVFPAWVVSLPSLHIAWTHPELIGGEQHLVIKNQFGTKSPHEKLGVFFTLSVLWISIFLWFFCLFVLFCFFFASICHTYKKNEWRKRNMKEKKKKEKKPQKCEEFG